MLPHGRYLIFYRERGEAVRSERIMHSARDIGSDDLPAGGQQKPALSYSALDETFTRFAAHCPRELAVGR